MWRIWKKLRVLMMGAALFVPAVTALAQDEILLRTSGSLDTQLAARYNLTVLGSDTRHNLYRARVPAGSAAEVAAALVKESGVVGAEVHARASLPTTVQLNQSTVSVLNQSTVSVLNSLDQSTVSVLNAVTDLTATPFYGSQVANGYVAQPAMKIVQNNAAHTLSTGLKVLIADIDNGVDPNHPALQGVLVPGFNFLNNSNDLSVFSGMDQSTVSVLNQSMDLYQSTVSVLNQSTVAVLNQSTVSVLNSLPAAWGHGTEVAGVLHLVAPQSQILPLKAFSADGTGQLFDIIRALYFAVDQGAQVVNMSFSCDCNSKELVAAINYAVSRGVILAGSVGNDNSLVRLFPAAYPQVLGIAATNFDDTRAAFSNYGGGSTFVSAPGAGVISAFPGGKYAAVWGTSFSAPMVAGQAALLLQRGVTASSVQEIISESAVDNTALNASTYIGHGRIDLFKALQSY